jgi:glycosyltransferase involved in cell wall biosynthesis
MKLDIISPFPPAITGIGQYGYHVSRTLEGSGHFSQITVLAGTQAGAQQAVSLSPVTTVDYAWRPDHPETLRKLMQSIRLRKPDLVWFNIGASVFGRSPLVNLLGLLHLTLIRKSGYPTVVTLHELVELADLDTLRAPGGKLARLGARVLTQLATNADVVCLTMRHYTEWLRRQMPAVPVLHIPIGAYQAPVLVAEPEQLELLFFSSLAPYKGLEVLIEAYRSLLPDYPSLRLTIAGAVHPRFPGYPRQIQRMISSQAGIRFLGQVAETEIRAMFSQASIVVLPYLASTGSSSVLYQSASWGRALVASDLRETRAVAEEHGLQVNFFRNRDASALAEVLRRLIAAPQRRSAQAQHNFAAIQNIRPEETCARYIRAFNLALATHQVAKRIPAPEGISQEAV